jgi:hypothetical protein
MPILEALTYAIGMPRGLISLMPIFSAWPEFKAERSAWRFVDPGGYIRCFFLRGAQCSENPVVRAGWHANALSKIKLRPAENWFGQVSKAANETMLEY